MGLPKVFIVNPTLSKTAYEVLGDSFDVITNTGYDRQSILQGVAGVDAILWSGGRVSLNKEVLDAAGPNLKVIALTSVGYNHVDLKELKLRGIKITNCPAVSDTAVADMAILLALAASRRLTEGRKHIEEGTWKNIFNANWMMGQDIVGSTIGVLGLGNIGQSIVRRLKGFDIGRVLYTGHKEKPEAKELGAQLVTLDTLARESDFVFVAAPLTNETDKMCNEEFFSKMKKTGVIVNIARGQLIDQGALIKALKEGQIFAAGLDVMVPEPLNVDSELIKLPNVVLAPHIATATQKTRNAMAELAAKNIVRGLKGEKLLTPLQ